MPSLAMLSVGVWISPPKVAAWPKPTSSSRMISTFGAPGFRCSGCARRWCLESCRRGLATLALGTGWKGSTEPSGASVADCATVRVNRAAVTPNSSRAAWIHGHSSSNRSYGRRAAVGTAAITSSPRPWPSRPGCRSCSSSFRPAPCLRRRPPSCRSPWRPRSAIAAATDAHGGLRRRHSWPPSRRCNRGRATPAYAVEAMRVRLRPARP